MTRHVCGKDGLPLELCIVGPCPACAEDASDLAVVAERGQTGPLPQWVTDHIVSLRWYRDRTPEIITTDGRETLLLADALDRAQRERGVGVYADIAAERTRQDAQWGGPEHDDTHHAGDWRAYREGFESRADVRDIQGTPFREHIVKIAALAVAQIESLDRRASHTPPEGKL